MSMRKENHVVVTDCIVVFVLGAVYHYCCAVTNRNKLIVFNMYDKRAYIYLESASDVVRSIVNKKLWSMVNTKLLINTRFLVNTVKPRSAC